MMRAHEVVVHAAIDDVDAAQSTGGAHIDDIVVGDQVAALDQLDAHLTGEVGVLKVGGVEDSGREEDDVGVGSSLGCQRAQRAQQELGVLLDGADVIAAEELREDALHHAAVGQHVTDAGGDAEIVFEDDELAVLHSDKICSADRDVDVSRDLQADHLAAEVFTAIDKLARDDAVLEDAALVVDVLEEEVEGCDALRQSTFDRRPLGGGDDAGDGIVGEYLLGAFFASVYGEGDSLIEEAEVGGLLAAVQLRHVGAGGQRGLPV